MIMKVSSDVKNGSTVSLLHKISGNTYIVFALTICRLVNYIVISEHYKLYGNCTCVHF